MGSKSKVNVAKARAGRWLRPALRSVEERSVDAAIDRPTVIADPYRHLAFPNNIREVRMSRGHLKLLPFSAQLPDIPYIRLSKIERGEVFARADELVGIAATLDVAPTRLLIDVASPEFDIAAWFAPFAEGAVADDPGEARMALLLAAAVRRARAADPQLTAAVVNDRYGLAPVILSRIENAQKGLSRWSPDIVAAIGRMLGGRDEPTLRSWLSELHAGGDLDRFLAEIVGPEDRQERTRQRVAALAIELERPAAAPVRPAPADTSPARRHDGARRIAVLGMPDADGTIALAPTGETMPAPSETGARAYGVRVARATLGPGLPAGTIVVVDPDRYPRAGGLALVREGARHRLVSVIADRTGALVGHSLYPEREVVIDTLDVGAVAAVVAAAFA